MKAKPPAEFSISGSGSGKGVDLPNPERVRRVARRAAQLDTPPAFSEEEFLEGLLSLEEAANRLSCGEEELREAISEGRILAIDDGAGKEFVPAFQTNIDPEDLTSIVRPVSDQLAPVCASRKTLWLWFLSPKEELGGRSPVRWIRERRDGGLILLAAKRDAARLAAG